MLVSFLFSFLEVPIVTSVYLVVSLALDTTELRPIAINLPVISFEIYATILANPIDLHKQLLACPLSWVVGDIIVSEGI